MGGLKLNPISQLSKEIGELTSRIMFLESEVVRLDRALNNLGRKYHEHHVNNHAVYGNTKGRSQ